MSFVFDEDVIGGGDVGICDENGATLERSIVREGAVDDLARADVLQEERAAFLRVKVAEGTFFDEHLRAVDALDGLADDELVFQGVFKSHLVDL